MTLMMNQLVSSIISKNNLLAEPLESSSMTVTTAVARTLEVHTVLDYHAVSLAQVKAHSTQSSYYYCHVPAHLHIQFSNCPHFSLFKTELLCPSGIVKHQSAAECRQLKSFSPNSYIFSGFKEPILKGNTSWPAKRGEFKNFAESKVFCLHHQVAMITRGDATQNGIRKWY